MRSTIAYNQQIEFLIFQVYLSSNIFRIPSQILLPEDALQHKFPTSEEEENETIEEIENIKKEIIKVNIELQTTGAKRGGRGLESGGIGMVPV